MQGMKGPLQMGGTGQRQALWPGQVGVPVLRAIEMGLVGIGVPTRARMHGNVDERELRLALAHDLFAIIGVEQQIKVGGHVLALLREHVEHMGIDPVIRILHRRAP